MNKNQLEQLILGVARNASNATDWVVDFDVSGNAYVASASEGKEFVIFIDVDEHMNVIPIPNHRG